MTTKELLSKRNQNGVLSVENEAANWVAISRDGVNMITFYNTDDIKFYANETSWAKRIISLLKRGY